MTQLWPWQQGAVDFALDPSRQRGAIWNMGMGTGKSLCAIETARRLFAKRILIVAPKAAISENAWGKQFREYGGRRFQVSLLTKGSSKRKAELAQRTFADAQAHGKVAVNAINYETLWTDAFGKHAMRGSYDLVVYDECHKLKGPRSRVSRFAYQLSRQVQGRGGRVLMLTGTLMPHSPLDVWAQMRALDPTLYGTSYIKFRARYAVMGGFENRQVLRYKNLAQLKSLLSMYAYRVPSTVLQYDAPIQTHIEVELPRDVRRAYKQMEDELVAEVNNGRVTAANGLVRLLRLQQFTSGYARLDGSQTAEPMHSAKEDALFDVLDGTMEEPVVVFGNFTGDQETTKRAASRAGRPYFELSGRSNALAEWDVAARNATSECPVLGVQIASGGTGIDLTASGVSVYLSTGFNMGNLDQSKARINRPGRKPIVRHIYIEAKDTIDTKIRHVLHNRKNLVEGVLSALTHQHQASATS